MKSIGGALNSNKIAVIGAGNAGLAFAADAKLAGKEVSLYNRSAGRIKAIIENDNCIEITGNNARTGNAKIDTVTQDMAEAVKDAKNIIVILPTNAHKEIAKNLAKHLQDGQNILLSPGATGGAFEFRNVLDENGNKADVTILESETIPYACRATGNTVKIFGYKKTVKVAADKKEKQDEIIKELSEIYPCFTSEPNGLWYISLSNPNAMAHPGPTLDNMSRMEKGEIFQYYIDGFTPEVAEHAERIDKERMAVAKAAGIETPSLTQMVQNYYSTHGKNLYESLQNNEAHKGIMAPILDTEEKKLSLRYIIEDVPTGLVPIEALGKKFGIATPEISKVIDDADALFKNAKNPKYHDVDFRRDGRNLKNMGLDKYSCDEIRQLFKN